jgi:predicted nucleic acid-binding Zn ribbon protein
MESEDAMPLLQFKCAKGHISERLYSPFMAPKVQTTQCDECRDRAERIVSVPAPAQFTGSGFYATDYKGKP